MANFHMLTTVDIYTIAVGVNGQPLDGQRIHSCEQQCEMSAVEHLQVSDFYPTAVSQRYSLVGYGQSV